MEIAIRTDRGPLRKPQRKGLALVVEGHAAREHKPGDPLRYAHGDEYRDASELKRIAGQLVGKPVTLGHPNGLIMTGATAKVVGRVDAAWVDGEHVACRMTVTDSTAAREIEAGTKELSLGYGTRVDAAGYQRDTEVDHCAIVHAARCGSTCSLRVDAVRLDCSTTCACGHVPSPGLSTDDVLRSISDDRELIEQRGAVLRNARALANRPPNTTNGR